MSRESVRHLIDHLMVRYGQLWFRMWEGLDAARVQEDWERQLETLSTAQLTHGVNHPNLPTNRVPTVAEFKALCLGAPRPLALPEPRPPKADKARVDKVMSQIPMLLAGQEMLQWARDLKAKEESGEFLTFLQRDAWRAALAREAPATTLPDDYQPVPVDALPQAMRPDAHTILPPDVEAQASK